VKSYWCSSYLGEDVLIRIVLQGDRMESEMVQPFGINSNGVIFAEGYGAMLLESQQHRLGQINTTLLYCPDPQVDSSE
jgi:hypothetical protein